MDRNGCVGMKLYDHGIGNLVTRNSATGDGWGIHVHFGSAQNTVQDNTFSGNLSGIVLTFGATSNLIQGNTTNLNDSGIWLEAGATGNSIRGNTALDNSAWDLGDQNFNCNSNAWSNNTLVTDNAAGAGDGGPGAGCIR